MISESYYQDEDNDANLAYWLSNTSTLLFMLQQSLKSGGTGATPLRKSPSLVRWMTKVNILFLSFFLFGHRMLQKLNNPDLLFIRVSVLQRLKLFDQLMPKIQLCISSSNLKHMLKRLLESFGITWKRSWTLSLLSASRCYDPQCFSTFISHSYVCCSWHERESF